MKLQLLTVFSLLQLSAGNPRLVCEETVETRIGDNVTLTCYLEPKENIEKETIDCKIADSSQLVYVYRNRKQLPDQEDQYRHRTSLDFEDLKIGVLNLTINSVTQSDEGTYQFCIRTKRIRSTVTLIVGAPPPPSSVPPPPSSVTPPSSVSPPPLSVPPPHKIIGVAVGVSVGGVIILCVFVLGVVLFLVKPNWIQPHRTRMMMMMRAPMSQHDDEDPHRAAGNGHLPPGQPAERETMLALE